MAARLSRFARRLLRTPAWLYRCHCGWLLGHRCLLLIHTGRRTRQRRYTVLEVMEFRPDIREATVMSGWGSNADWLRNIEATPGPEVMIGRQRFIAAHRLLGTDEAAAMIARYEQRNWMIAPIVRRGLSWLLGWRYDGSDAARHKAAAQMPYVAFRPRD